MSAFFDAQVLVKRELDRLGADGVTWDWDTAGWSAAAPNGGRRWTCKAAGCEGRGGTGEEALYALLSQLKAREVEVS